MPGQFITAARVVQARKSNGSAVRPGTSYDDQAGFVVVHLQVLPHGSIWYRCPHHLLGLL